MTAGAYAAFYDGVYRPLVSAFHGRLIDARTIQGEQQEYAVDRADTVRPFLAGAGLKTMLDIGGSTGVVAAHFAREFGLARHAASIRRPLEVEHARALGLETITGLVETHDFGVEPVRRGAHLPDRSITCSTSAARCGACASC